MAYSQKEIFSGTSVYAVGQMLTKGFAFLLIPLYTTYLTPDDYGIIGYLGVILQLGATIMLFGFHGAQTRFFYKIAGRVEEMGEYLFSINVWLVGISVFVLVVVSVWGEQIYNLITDSQIPFEPYVRLILWVSVFQLFNQLIISYALARKEYFKSALLQVGLFVALTAFTIYLVVIRRGGALGQVRSLLYGNMSFLAIIIWQYMKHFRVRIRWAHVAYSLVYGVPITIHLISGVLLTSVSRLILEGMVPLSQLGMFTVGYQIGLIVNVINLSMNNAWQPSYFSIMEEQSPDNDARIRRTYNLYSIILTMMCVSGVVFGSSIYRLMTPASYAGGEVVVGLVMLGYFFNGFYFFASSPIFFFENTKYLPLATGTAVICNIALNYTLIPFFGIMGSAVATALSYLVQMVFIHLIGRRVYDHKFDTRVILAGGSIMTITMIVLPVVTNVWYKGFIGATIILGTGLLLRAIFPEEMATWIKKVRALARGQFK